MNKKLIAGALSALMAATALSACGGNDSPNGDGSAAAAGSGKVSLIAKANASDYWTLVKNGAMAAGKDLGVEVNFNGPDTESEGDKQLNQLDNAINDKPLGVGFAPQDGAQDGAPNYLKKAKEAKIPVVLFDTALSSPSDVPLTVIASDNKSVGAEAAKHMCELAGGKGEVAIVAHGLVGTAAQRRDGFKEAIAKDCTGMKLVDVQNGESDPAKSRDKAQGILQAHPQLAGFFGTDDDSAIAIADQVKQMNSKAKVIGVDFTPDVQSQLEGDQISGVMVQNPYQIGYDTVKTLVEASKGTQPSSKNIVMPAIWVNKDNLQTEEVKKVIGA